MHLLSCVVTFNRKIDQYAATRMQISSKLDNRNVYLLKTAKKKFPFFTAVRFKSNTTEGPVL
jgi:hypothetical protein